MCSFPPKKTLATQQAVAPRPSTRLKDSTGIAAPRRANKEMIRRYYMTCLRGETWRKRRILSNQYNFTLRILRWATALNSCVNRPLPHALCVIFGDHSFSLVALPFTCTLEVRNCTVGGCSKGQLNRRVRRLPVAYLMTRFRMVSASGEPPQEGHAPPKLAAICQHDWHTCVHHEPSPPHCKHSSQRQNARRITNSGSQGSNGIRSPCS